MDIFSDSQPEGEYLIETVGVTKIFKDEENMSTACSDVSLKVKAGDFIIIFGITTSGKTTLLSIIYGFEKPDIGEVLLKGEPLYEFSENERCFIRAKKFGFVPHNHNWIRNLNLLDNVALPVLVSGQKEEVARTSAYEALRYFGLEKNFELQPHLLGFYEQQLASIARAMVNQPWLILADEPYKNLTHNDALKVISLLKKINEDKKIAMIVSTSKPEFLNYTSKWFLMSDGRIEDIKNNRNSISRFKNVVELIEKETKKENEKNISI